MLVVWLMSRFMLWAFRSSAGLFGTPTLGILAMFAALLPVALREDAAGPSEGPHQVTLSLASLSGKISQL